MERAGLPRHVSLLVLLCTAPPLAWAENWYLTAYMGRAADERLVEILIGTSPTYERDRLIALGVGRTLGASGDLHWELEGQLAQHSHGQTHQEINGVLVARWTRLPWDRHVDTTLAAGQGLSFATQHPPIEGGRGETRRLLHYLLVEATIAIPDQNWRLIGRIHHRSGVFGLYGTAGGSNYLTIGVRVDF